MGAAADDILGAFDKYAFRVHRRIREEEEEDTRKKEGYAREGATARERLFGIMRGERPTRETHEQYRKRKGDK